MKKLIIAIILALSLPKVAEAENCASDLSGDPLKTELAALLRESFKPEADIYCRGLCHHNIFQFLDRLSFQGADLTHLKVLVFQYEVRNYLTIPVRAQIVHNGLRVGGEEMRYHVVLSYRGFIYDPDFAPNALPLRDYIERVLPEELNKNSKIHDTVNPQRWDHIFGKKLSASQYYSEVQRAALEMWQASQPKNLPLDFFIRKAGAELVQTVTPETNSLRQLLEDQDLL